MKPIFIALFALFLFACQDKTNKKAVFTKPTYDYLIGNWKRLNDKDSLQTFEHWVKNSDTLYIGHGYTLKMSDTVWQEHIKIKPYGNGMVYEVTDTDNHIVPFIITSNNDTSFVCENKENEFPKMIKYRKNGNGLFAAISGGGDEIGFEFERK